MTSRAFWDDVRKKWIKEAPPKITDIKTGMGGPIDPNLLVDPWESDEVPFDLVDHEKAFDAVVKGKDIPINKKAAEQAAKGADAAKMPKRPKLDSEKFDELIEKRTFPDYMEACKMLTACELPRKMNDIYGKLIDRMNVLNDVLEQNKSRYAPKIEKFHDIYVPEALHTTETYLEFLNIGVDGETLSDTETEVIKACDSLLVAVNEKIEEIFKHISMEIQAEAKGLSMKIEMDGYGNPGSRIDQ